MSGGIFAIPCLGLGAGEPDRLEISKDKQGHWILGPDTLQGKIKTSQTQANESYLSTKCPKPHIHTIFKVC